MTIGDLKFPLTGEGVSDSDSSESVDDSDMGELGIEEGVRRL